MVPVYYTDIFEVELPKNHRFPMEKYALTRQYLLHAGILHPNQMMIPTLMDWTELEIVHQKSYLDALRLGSLDARLERLTGFPQSPAMNIRSLASVSATCQMSMLALETGISVALSGGTHHAFRDRGEGFCIFNDVAVASARLLRKNLAKKILIIDLDVHQGNGTAAIFEHDKRVYTFSMHCQANYPFRKEKSDLDIGLEIGTKDELYLALLEEKLKVILEQFQPDFVFYNAGVDCLAGDRLGKLSISMKGLQKRDLLVLDRVKSQNIPLSIVMGGGYHPDIWQTVLAYAQVVTSAVEVYS
jgi:acetoin utilization deacetylase AcuC-like enzyme